MTRIRTRLAAIALALAVPAALAGCFGGGSSDDPQDVLNETFNGDHSVSSGQIDATFSFSIEGDQGGELTAELTGPFQSNPDDPTEFPQLDLSATANGDFAGQSLDFQGGLVATSDAAFVEYQNQAYEVPAQTFDSFKQSYQQQAEAAQATGEDSGSTASAFFDQAGVDPSSWLTNVSNEGTEDVEGVSTIHIHGDANVGQIISDFGAIAAATPGAAAQGLDPQSLGLAQGLIEGAVQEASIDVYSGEDDSVLRRLDFHLAIDANELSQGQVGTVDVSFTLTLSGVNEDQTITAPESSKKLSDLLDELGVDLGPLGSLGTGSIPGLGTGGTGGTGGASGADAQAFQDYADCVQAAGTDVEAINACIDKLK